MGSALGTHSLPVRRPRVPRGAGGPRSRKMTHGGEECIFATWQASLQRAAISTPASWHSGPRSHLAMDGRDLSARSRTAETTTPRHRCHSPVQSPPTAGPVSFRWCRIVSPDCRDGVVLDPGTVNTRSWPQGCWAGRHRSQCVTLVRAAAARDTEWCGPVPISRFMPRCLMPPRRRVNWSDCFTAGQATTRPGSGIFPVPAG